MISYYVRWRRGTALNTAGLRRGPGKNASGILEFFVPTEWEPW